MSKDPWIIICPHCGEEVVVEVDYTESSTGQCFYSFRNDKPVTEMDEHGYDGFRGSTNSFIVHRHYCSECNHNLTTDEILAGRNNYLATATKETK